MLPPNHNDRAIWFFLFLVLLFFIASFAFTQYQISQIQNKPVLPTGSQPTSQPIVSDSCGSACREYINQAISQALSGSTPLPTTKPQATSQTISQPSQGLRITYIPLSGGNTQSTDWVDLANSQFILNFGDYGSKAYATWDASLRVDNANGQAFARLFDVTHGIAVNGSEISITNTSQSTDVVSGQLSFWQGNNTYRVQIKSLNSFIVYMDSGRIKINY